MIVYLVYNEHDVPHVFRTHEKAVDFKVAELQSFFTKIHPDDLPKEAEKFVQKIVVID